MSFLALISQPTFLQQLTMCFALRGCPTGSVRIPLCQNSATYSSVTILPLLFAMLLDLLPFASFFIRECSVLRSSLYNYDNGITHRDDLRTKSLKDF